MRFPSKILIITYVLTLKTLGTMKKYAVSRSNTGDIRRSENFSKTGDIGIFLMMSKAAIMEQALPKSYWWSKITFKPSAMVRQISFEKEKIDCRLGKLEVTPFLGC